EGLDCKELSRDLWRTSLFQKNFLHVFQVADYVSPFSPLFPHNLRPKSAEMAPIVPALVRRSPELFNTLGKLQTDCRKMVAIKSCRYASNDEKTIDLHLCQTTLRSSSEAGRRGPEEGLP